MRHLPYERTITSLVPPLVFMGLIAVWCSGWFQDSVALNDCWRRTAVGWERTDDWSGPGNAASVSDAENPVTGSSRYDSHPAALALAEIVLVGMAFYVFPRSQEPLATRSGKGWLALLSDSFRVSAFGC